MSFDAEAAAPSSPKTWVRAMLAGLADIALPPQCLSCGRPLATHGALCPACWGKLRLIEQPYCVRLGTPFPYDPGEDSVSLEALADPPPFDRCRAVALFDDVSRSLVHGLKYRDHLELAAWMGEWMARAGTELTAEADIILPVPLHPRRLWWRRSNQSALLAAEIGRRSGRRVETTALLRVRATEQQVGLTADQRDRNVRGAFRVHPKAKTALAGRRVLLVDDVYTTGATVKAAARTLLRAGASAVDVLVFARVVRAGV